VENDIHSDNNSEEIGVRKWKAVVTSTVRRWLRKQGLNWRDVKKGVYVDGHEREDVVEFRKRFIERLEELWPYVVEFEDDGTMVNKVYPEDCMVGGPGRRPIILVTHDESTFSSNDGRRQAWTGPTRQFLRPKGRGQGIMVSDFLLPWCRLSTERLSEQERRNTQLPLYATKYLEYGKTEGYWDGKDLVAHVIEVALPILRKIYPGYQILFLFDNSSNHGTYAEDALRVQSMSLKPGGLGQKLLRPGYMYGDRTQVQEMTYTTIDPATGAEIAEAKGMKDVLQERGLWKDGLSMHCPKNLCYNCKIYQRCKECKAGTKCDGCKQPKKHSGKCTQRRKCDSCERRRGCSLCQPKVRCPLHEHFSGRDCKACKEQPPSCSGNSKSSTIYFYNTKLLIRHILSVE